MVHHTSIFSLCRVSWRRGQGAKHSRASPPPDAHWQCRRHWQAAGKHCTLGCGGPRVSCCVNSLKKGVAIDPMRRCQSSRQSRYRKGLRPAWGRLHHFACSTNPRNRTPAKWSFARDLRGREVYNVAKSRTYRVYACTTRQVTFSSFFILFHPLTKSRFSDAVLQYLRQYRCL